MKKISIALLATFIVLLNFNCASPTKITTTGLGFKADDYKKKSYKKIIVLSRVKDQVIRQKMENSLADLFDRSGQKAVASYKVLSADDLSSQENFIAKLKELDVDALIAYTFYGTTNSQASDQITFMGGNLPSTIPVTTIGWFNVFLSPGYAFDINTQVNTTTRVRTEFYNKDSKDIRWYKVVEVEMNNGVDIGCDQLAGRTLMIMKQDGIF